MMRCTPDHQRAQCRQTSWSDHRVRSPLNVTGVDFTRIMPQRITINSGAMADYDALSHHHYRGGRPAAPVRIFTARMSVPTIIARINGRESDSQCVGVLVVSMPRLSARGRDIATGGRYRALRPTERARLINDEVRTISRVIADPRFRGLGIASGLVRHALHNATTPYTEALAAMGRMHPFFEAAGMQRIDVPQRRCDERLAAALQCIGLSITDLAGHDALPQRMDATALRVLTRELKRWCAAQSSPRGHGDGNASDFAHMCRRALTGVLERPVYYIHHRDR